MESECTGIRAIPPADLHIGFPGRKNPNPIKSTSQKPPFSLQAHPWLSFPFFLSFFLSFFLAFFLSCFLSSEDAYDKIIRNTQTNETKNRSTSILPVADPKSICNHIQVR